MNEPETVTIQMQLVRPLGTPINRDAIREVWDSYIKPGQDSGMPQSVEERILMAVLRSVYAGLPPTEREPDADA